LLLGKINNIKEHLETCKDIPKDAIIAYGNLLPQLRLLTRTYLPESCNAEDFNDAEAAALENGLKYIRLVEEQGLDHSKWSVEEWQRRLYSRFKNAVLESAKYLLSPISLPRPVRFSMKKYVDVIAIIKKYVKTENVATSDLYKVIFEKGCTTENIGKCVECKNCHIKILDIDDLSEINSLLTGERKSLSYYAKLYRKSYDEWIRLLESVKEFSYLHDISEETEMEISMDNLITLKRFKDKLNKVHPKLYEIYCHSICDTDTDRLNEKLEVFTPRGWLNKDIKELYDLTSPEFKQLLEEGDRVLNEFRKNEGLRPIQRKLWSEFTK